jgi:hypothetical protein
MMGFAMISFLSISAAHLVVGGSRRFLLFFHLTASRHGTASASSRHDHLIPPSAGGYRLAQFPIFSTLALFLPSSHSIALHGLGGWAVG